MLELQAGVQRVPAENGGEAVASIAVAPQCSAVLTRRRWHRQFSLSGQKAFAKRPAADWDRNHGCLRSMLRRKRESFNRGKIEACTRRSKNLLCADADVADAGDVSRVCPIVLEVVR